jgi:type IV secretion system protein TrbE
MGIVSSLLLMGAGAAVTHLSNRLQEDPAEPGALSDRVGWAGLVAPGVLMQKDASLMIGAEFLGPDKTAATPEDLNLLSRDLNRAHLPNTDSWTLNYDYMRFSVTGYPRRTRGIPDVAEYVDAERRNDFSAEGRRFGGRGILTATWTPPADSEELWSRAIRKGAAEAELGWGRHLAVFLDEAGLLLDRLGARLAVRRLTSAELLSHLRFCVSGVHQRITPPPVGVRLDHLLAPGMWHGGTHPRIGGRPVRVVTWDGFPEHSHAGQLDSLLHLNFPYRWSTRVIPLGMQAASRAIDRDRLNWFQKRKGAGQLLRESAARKERTAQQQEDDELFENSHARVMALSAKEAAAANQAGQVRYAHYDAAVVLHGDTEAEVEARAEAVLKHMSNHGFNALIERDNAGEATFASFPGNGSDNVRRPLLSTRNVVDLLPFTSVWGGESEVRSKLFPPASPALVRCDGAGATPFWFNPYASGDLGNTILFGAPGAGKSTLIAFLMTQWVARYGHLGGQVLGYDKGASTYLATKGLGGVFRDLRPGDSETAFQPLRRVDEPGEGAWAAEWVELICKLQGVSLTVDHRAAIRKAVELVAAMPREARTLTALLYQIQDESRLLEQALEAYTARGLYGGIFDAVTDRIATAPVETTELFWLRQRGPKVELPVLDYLFHRDEPRFRADIPTFLWVDEAGPLLAHQDFGPKLADWATTRRKYNVWLLLSMQAASQLLKVDELTRDQILEASPVRIFCPNPQARESTSAEAYRAAGLNEKEIDLIASAIPKRQYYIKSPAGSRLFEPRLSPAAVALLTPRAGLDTDGLQAHVTKLVEHHGRRWPAVWLQEAGLDGPAREFLKMGGYDENER